MSVRSKWNTGVLLLGFVFVASSASLLFAADLPDKTAASTATISPQSVSPLLDSNLAIFSSEMRLVLRYDAEANSLIAAISDKDGPALWYAKSVTQKTNSDGSVSLSALAVLKFGGPVWVDWQKFDIKISSDYSVSITKSSPLGRASYKGRAVKIKTNPID